MVTIAVTPIDSPSNAQSDGDIDDAAPIDGGLSLLVAAGVGYGAKKLKERKNINKN